MSCIVVFTTVGNLEEARRIARSLVERKLVACAQISEIESYYEWEGAVRNDTEYRLLLKTTQGQYVPVEQAIRQMHSYDLPAIHALAVEHIHEPYAAWIEDNCSGK